MAEQKMWFFPSIAYDALTIVFFVFCFTVFVQFIFLIVFPTRILRFSKKNESEKKFTPAVSVIICARNEEDHLAKNLPLILAQDYPNFEVIVVNDQSLDESSAILKAMQTKNSHLRLIDLSRNQHKRIGKKLPLTVGIKGAKHEYLLLTDADCRPKSDQWIKKMIQSFQSEKEMVLGFSPYARRRGFLNKLIRFDTAMIGSNYMGFALAGKPYMGVGRNLAYKKTLFFRVDGFKDHYHIQSGDDDLFVQQAAKKENVTVQFNPLSHTRSAPKETWTEWIKQKQRHFTTAESYRLINKILLGIFPISMFILLSSFVTLMIYYEWWPFVLAIFGLRTLIYWLTYRKILNKLEEKDLSGWFPLLELIHFVIIPFIYYAKNRSSKKW